MCPHISFDVHTLFAFNNVIFPNLCGAMRKELRRGIYGQRYSDMPAPTLMAQLDARPTGDQEVAGSTPAGSPALFRRDLIMKYFLRSFSPFR